MLIDLITNYLLQIAFTVGIIFIFGLLIALCNKIFYRNFGRYSRAVCYATGFIGTPVHEVSHALFCLIFGHKIIGIKLFQINSVDGVLGYVNHSFNPKNIYHRIGNFFIGVAPIIVITALLYLSAYLLLPVFTAKLVFMSGGVSFYDAAGLFNNIWDAAYSFFALAGNWQWWVFLLIGILLSLHMTLSTADIRGAAGGLLLLLALVMTVDVILILINVELLNGFTRTAVAAGSFLLFAFLISFMISLVAVLISFAVKLFIRNR